jgi:anti-sigma B factor antagonist
VKPAGPEVLAALCRDFRQACRVPRMSASCSEGDDLVIEVRYLRKMIDGVPVMATPPEIDVTTAEQLRAVLLAATENRYRTLVVDMTRTRFCDSAAVHALIAAHKRVLAEGGELRLVVPADGAVHRVLTLLGIDHFIHCFANLEEA